jgi:hypothetical protein
MTVLGTNSKERVVTFATPLGWITAIGEFSDNDVLWALYLAWQIRQKSRDAASIAKAFGARHAILSTRATDANARYRQPGNPINQQILALTRRHAKLVDDVQQLSAIFVNKGYDNLRFDGRIGRHLLPFEGHGLATASYVVATIVQDSLAASDIDVCNADSSDDAIIEQFKTLINLRHVTTS